MLPTRIKRRQDHPIFKRPGTRLTHSINHNSKLEKNKSITSMELPNIYTKQLKPALSINISDPNTVRKQLGKILSFKKDRYICLLPQLYQQLPEKVKAVGYSSHEYLQKLEVVNRILNSCDLNAKQREIMVARGEQSQNYYIFFTNFIYHPISLCCDETVILKCIDKEGIQTQQQKYKVLNNNRWQFVCLGCLKILLKLNQNELQPKKHSEKYQQKRKLLDFALHIASGRYKKHLLQDDPATISFQHVKSRFTFIPPRKITQSSS